MPDFARQTQWLVDVAYPNAPAIRVVMDNLSIHRMASLYETFSLAEARRIVKRPEFHHHHHRTRQLAQSYPELAEGMAEIEFGVLIRY